MVDADVLAVINAMGDGGRGSRSDVVGRAFGEGLSLAGLGEVSGD